MIGDGVRFEGFDTHGWLSLIGLFQRAPDEAAEAGAAVARRRGVLVLITDAHDVPRAGFVTGRGALDPDTCREPWPLERLCRRLGAERAVALQIGALEELTERATERMSPGVDYAAQWLALLESARELEDEGKLRFWPARARVPLPTPAMLKRVLDLILPDDRVLLVTLWDGEAVDTGFALLRSGGTITRVVGPELLREWAGPLGGDYRRDHRVLQRAVERALGPLQLGLFAQRARVRELLRDPSPGAWARAVALREVIISPVPAYVHVAVGADLARAAGHRARSFLFGLDLYGYVAPAARFAREHVTRIGSATSILGFNPLQILAERLRKPRGARPEE